MKTSQTMKIGLVLGILGWGAFSQAWAQGFLNPAAAPAPTMKSLTQIYSAVELAEPRTPLSFANTPGMSSYLYAITNSGSYYLTEDTTVVNGGILVLASNVTLDLSGFKLEGNPANAYHGIFFPGCDNLAVRNGTVARFGDSGLYSGYLTTGTGFNASDLRVLQNSENGMLISAYGTAIQHCLVMSNGAAGIESWQDTIIENTTCKGNAYDGMYVGRDCVLTGNTCSENGWAGLRTSGDCVIRENTTKENGKEGIDADRYSLVQNNSAIGNAWSGISVTYGSQVRDNVLVGNNTDLSSISGGIFMQTGSHAVGNTLYTNEVQGIYVWSADCVIEGNAISGSPTGITFKVNGSLYVNNRFSGLGTDVDGTSTDGGGNISF